MINALMIALEYPPTQAAGAFRALRFVTHLPALGVRPIIVSYNAGQLADGKVHVVNPNLTKRLPSSLPIYALDVSALEKDKTPLTTANEFSALYRGHYHDFHSLFSGIQRDHDIDVVWTTCPPFNVGPLALAAKRHFKRPLMLDMRDAWSQWGTSPFRTWFHYKRVVEAEREMLNGVDAVTCVTPQLVDMERKVSGVGPQRFHWIPNAYEQDELPATALELPAGLDRLRVGYAGQFYFNALHENADGIIPWYRKQPHRWLHYYATGQRWIYRTPYFFFRAWSALRKSEPALGDRIEFHVVGNVPDWLPGMARDLGVEDRCTWHGLKPKHETQAIMDGCDAFLSTSIKVIGGEDYCLASKTFDYIAAGKPVLGFVCPGTQLEFLERSNIAVIVDPDNTEAAAKSLRDVMLNGVRREVDARYLARYSSHETTRQLADLIKLHVRTGMAAPPNLEGAA